MILDYKGYVAQVDLDEDGDFHGRVLNTRDVINFYGNTAAELQEEFARSVETYLAVCEEEGREAERPFSGKLMIRVPPAVHRALAVTAARHHMSLNRLILERLSRDLDAIEEVPPPFAPTPKPTKGRRRATA
jgi:predicted HicB family RNase H-like nuclease